MKRAFLLTFLVVAGCMKTEPETLPDGSANCNYTPYSPYSGPILQAYNRAYQEACRAEKAKRQARARGQTVVECMPDGAGGNVCVAE